MTGPVITYLMSVRLRGDWIQGMRDVWGMMGRKELKNILMTPRVPRLTLFHSFFSLIWISIHVLRIRYDTSKILRIYNYRDINNGTSQPKPYIMNWSPSLNN